MKALCSMTLASLIALQSKGVSSDEVSLKDFEESVRLSGERLEKGRVYPAVKVAFAIPSQQVSDYWRRTIASLRGRMKEIGIECSIQTFSTGLQESRALRECMQRALESKPDYLATTITNLGDEAVIERVLASGKSKVIIQNMTQEKEQWSMHPPFLYVGFDQAKGTEMIADEYIRRFADKSRVKYAMLYWRQNSHVSSLRGDYFNSQVQKDPKFQLVAEYYTGGLRDRAAASVKQIIDKHPDLDFIYACSTDTAFGALSALQDLGLENRIVVNGWGGGANELDSILSGKLDFTVMRMNDDNGVAIAEAIRIDLLRGTPPRTYSGDMVIVGDSSGPEIVKALKAKSFRYSK